MPVHEEPSTPKFKAYILVEVDFSYDQFKNLREPDAVAMDFVEYTGNQLKSMAVEFDEVKKISVFLDEVAE